MPAIVPADYEKFLGHTFVVRQNRVALQIGDKTWSRWELANVFGLPHYRSAGALTYHLRRTGVRTMEHLYALSPDELARVPGLGETAVYVAASVLHTEGFDTKHWAGYSEKGLPPVTFRTLKLRVKRELARRTATSTKHRRRGAA